MCLHVAPLKPCQGLGIREKRCIEALQFSQRSRTEAFNLGLTRVAVERRLVARKDGERVFHDRRDTWRPQSAERARRIEAVIAR